MFKFLNVKAIYFVALTLALLLVGNLLTTTTFAQDDFVTDDMNWEWTNEELRPYSDSFIEPSMTEMTEQEAAMAFGIVALIWGAIMLPIYIYTALSLMTIAKKLGISSAWFAWIPILNLILLCRCAGIRSWFFLLFLIAPVNLVILIYVFMKIAERRGFENWIGILTIVPIIGIAIPGYLAWAEPQKKAT